MLRANWQLRTGEIDLLAEDRAGRWVIVEVRGYHPGGREPARVLSQAKQRRLRALAQYLGARYRRAVRIELVEVTGRAPRTRWARALWWLAARWHAPGFRCRAREL